MIYVTKEASYMRRTNHLLWTGCIIASIALTACGMRTTDAMPGQSVTPAGTSQALAAWSTFPVAAKPRPVVLLGSVVIGPASGFRSGADKNAFVSGNFTTSISLPQMTTTSEGQRVLSADQALQLLNGPRHNVTLGTPILVVTGATLAHTTFATDRGAQSLPAWAFTFRGVTDPVFVLALPQADRWPQGAAPTNQVVAVPGGSKADRRVTVWFVGGASGTGPCTVQYSASVEESPTAVMVTPNPVPGKASGGMVLCTLEGHRRSVTVTLAAPLGNRVVLTPNPAPAPIG